MPIEHTRSLAHVTLLDIDKQGESSRPLPEAIAVWGGSLTAPTTHEINLTLHDTQPIFTKDVYLRNVNYHKLRRPHNDNATPLLYAAVDYADKTVWSLWRLLNSIRVD